MKESKRLCFSNIVLLAVALSGAVVLRGISAEPARFSATDEGAVGDGHAMNTAAIQKTVDRCVQAGGGTVVIPKGEFLSGALFLKPGVSLELQEGAVLKGSTDINDYPRINTRIEGHSEAWRVALVNADGTDDLRITGPGTLDGNGAPYWAEFWRQRKLNPKVTNLAVERPRLILIQNSRDVTVSGVTFKDAGFWNLHLYHCQRAMVEDCRFQAPNGPPPNHAASSDGIDVDSCQDVNIRGCTFAVGDDCIALKGSKGPFAAQDLASPPVERVHVHGCTFEAGGAMLTCGSEATTVRDVEVSDCKIVGLLPLLRLKLRPDTAQRYENIVCRNIEGRGAGPVFDVAPWKQFFDLQGQPPPKRNVSKVTLSGLKGSFAALGKIVGNSGDAVSDIVLEDSAITTGEARLKTNVPEAIRFENFQVNGVSAVGSNIAVEPEPKATPKAWNTF